MNVVATLEADLNTAKAHSTPVGHARLVDGDGARWTLYVRRHRDASIGVMLCWGWGRHPGPVQDIHNVCPNPEDLPTVQRGNYKPHRVATMEAAVGACRLAHAACPPTVATRADMG